MNAVELFEPGLLQEMLDGGYVRCQKHPELPLRILNYSPKAAYDGVWNDVTLSCRGLILDENGAVVARPFRKFFNLGEPNAPTLDLDAEAVVTNKLDGSLGVLYPTLDGQHAIATRGSFTSDQALHATKVWRAKYAGTWTPYPRRTYLFEIIFPANRIVCDYGEMDDLVLLDILEIETGLRAVDYEWRFPGPWVEEFEYERLAEAVAAPDRANAEGFVVYLPAQDVRVKIKQADYVELHRIVTGLNERTVWQHLVDGKDIKELIEPLPDEFHDWVSNVAVRLLWRVASQLYEIGQTFDRVLAELPLDYERRDFAMKAKGYGCGWALFMLLDGKDPAARLLYNAKPEPVGPTGSVYSEDVA